MADLLVKLYQLPPLPPFVARLAAAGVTVRRAMAYEKKPVIDWVLAQFGSQWASECDISFSRQPPACMIAIESNSLLGFACYESSWRNFFGPTGVISSRRGQGIGKTLLLSALHSMAEMGYAYAVIGAAGDQSEFYKNTVNAQLIDDSSPGSYEKPVENTTGNKGH